MRRRFRWLRRAGLALLALFVVLVAANWRHIMAFPGILPAFTAKEYCSCRFVMRQGDAYCRDYTKQWLPIDTLLLDEAARRVTVHALGTTRSARWLSPREGCRLEPDAPA